MKTPEITSEKRATIKRANQMLAENGYPEVELVAGEGYYYFSGGIAHSFYTSNLGSYHIGTFKSIWDGFQSMIKDAIYYGTLTEESAAPSVTV